MKSIYKTRHIGVYALLAMLLVSCKSDDTDFSSIINDNKSPESIESGLQFDDSPFDEPTEVVPEGDNDYYEKSWEEHHLVTLTYSTNGVTIAGDYGNCTIAAKDGHVMALLGSDNIHFRLEGESDNASLKVYGKHRFMVSLGNLNLTNPNGAVINSQCGRTMYLVTEKDCIAKLSDGPEYQMYGEEDMKGCIFSEGQIIFSGEGSLTVESKAKNAIASDDYIVIRPGSRLNVKSTGSNGIKTNDGVSIRGGRINILTTSAGSKGISSETGVDIKGGRTIILNSGDIRIEGTDVTSAAAIKCDSTFTMTAGILRTESTGNGGKGINAKLFVEYDENGVNVVKTTGGNVRLLGGNLQIATFGEKAAYGDGETSSPRCIKADGYLEMGGATLRAYAEACKPVNVASTDNGDDIRISTSYKKTTQTDRYWQFE